MTPHDDAERVAQRDALAASLRAGFEAIIREADEWRPLADYILTHTREARRRALEEAAAIAETAGTTTTEFRDGNQVTRTTLDRAAIAAAIRAHAQERDNE